MNSLETLADLTAVLERNLLAIRTRMDQACVRGCRAPGSVQLVAVTKYVDPPVLATLLSLGHRDLGENRPEQLAERAAQWHAAARSPMVAKPPAAGEAPSEPRGDTEPRWHMIGHIQSRKLKLLPLDQLAVIHSVDSLKLATRLAERCSELAMADVPAGSHRPASGPAILLEVNLSGEAQKEGFSAAELRTVWPELQRLPGLKLAGLMTMAAWTDDPETARPAFRQLRELRDELQSTAREGITLGELSMGMSGDFEVAIEEGATLIRVGSSLFAGLPTHDPRG